MLTDAGATLTDTEVVAHFAEVMRRGLIEVSRRKIDRYNDRHDRTHHDPLFDPNRPSAVTFSELSEIYLAEKAQDYSLNGISQKRMDKVKASVTTLCAIIGGDTLTHTIDDDIVQNVRSIVARIPNNRVKLYPKLSLEQAIERGAKAGKPTLSSTTQRTYLDILRELLKVAVRKKLLTSNPAADIRPLQKDALASHDKRIPWTDQQIRGFFMGCFYRSCAPKAVYPYAKKDYAWRFWLPLIMLLSGARPNEVCQLNGHDIRQTDAGVWFMNMTDEGEGKSLKTDASKRRVPIHPELVRIGFLAFAEERRKAKNGPRLFPSLKPDKYGNMAHYPSKRFNEKLISAEIILDDRQSLYSLRHNVRDALRRIKAPPETLHAIAGWSPAGKAVSDDYGDAGNPDLHVEYVEKIAYLGLDLSFLYVSGATA
jgi:integrase